MAEIPEIKIASVPPPRQIRIPDYPDEQGAPQDVASFRKDVARQLGADPDRVVLRQSGEDWTAEVVGKPDKTGLLSFEDANDALRLRQIASSSRSPVLVDFGKEPLPRSIRISRLGRDAAPADGKPPADKTPEEKLRTERVERFKAQVLAQTQGCDHELRIVRDEGGLVAELPGGERHDLLFADPAEQQEFVALAEQSKAPELLYFGRERGGKVLTQEPFPDGLSNADFAREFRTRLALQLGTDAEHVQVYVRDGEVLAFVRHQDPVNSTLRELNFIGDGRIDVLFERPSDLERARVLAPTSKSPVLINFGVGPSAKRVHIPHYNANDGRDKNLQRFKDDVSRQMGTSPMNIEIKYRGGMLEANLVDSDTVVDIVFDDPQDFAFFLKEALQSKSSYLEYFGQKRSSSRAEFEVSSGFPNPHGKTVFNQTVSNETFIGNSGTNKVKTSVTASEPLSAQFLRQDNIKNVTLGFHNLNWGGGDVVFNGSAFSISGLESTFLTNKSNAIKDSYWGKIKKGDGEAILTGLGVAAGVVGVAYAFSELWPTPQDLAVPVRTRLYHNGLLEVNASSDQKLILGGHKRDFDWTGAGLEVKQNIESNVSAVESAAYNPKEEKLTAAAAFNYQRFNVGTSNVFDLKLGQRANTNLNTGYSWDLAPKWVLGLRYAQDIDAQGVTANPNLSNNVTWTPSTNWLFNLNTSVGAAKYGEPASYGVGFKTGIQF